MARSFAAWESGRVPASPRPRETSCAGKDGRSPERSSRLACSKVAISSGSTTQTVVVGEGRRTNAEGIRQLKTLLKDSLETLVVVPLPDYRGDHDVMHLMSLVSPVDEDLVVVYTPLLPKSCQDLLLDRGYGLVEVADDEFATMGTNVLALGPRDCVMLDGNPKTRAALERAGARVQVYEGVEISLKGGGGPTCLTRPLARGLD